MFDRSFSVPCKPDACPRSKVRVHEISSDPATLTGRCRRWHSEVQPWIDDQPDRADRNWNWRRFAILTTLAGARRRARIFQVTLGEDEKPAAMIAALEEERWPADPSRKACFLWFLSTAPTTLLQSIDLHGRRCTPKLVGVTAFHVALAVALEGEAEGRLWLHAAPAGKQALFDWYCSLGMEVIDPMRFPLLPGYDSPFRQRKNDGRYFWLDAEAGRDAHNAYLSAMRQT